jgi:hypothetical protein
MKVILTFNNKPATGALVATVAAHAFLSKVRGYDKRGNAWMVDMHHTSAEVLASKGSLTKGPYGIQLVA